MSDSDSLSPTAVDDYLSVLARDNCRTVLQYFSENPTDVATVGDLAEFICEREGLKDRAHVEISLYHLALPKLADAGLVDYDARSKTVRYRTTVPIEGWVTSVGETGESST